MPTHHVASFQAPRVARFLWALPGSLIGLALAAPCLAAGGRATWRSGALEVSHRPRLVDCGPLARRLPFRGIVFGHVILGVTSEELAVIGAHERVHVRQYEGWGPFFLPAYALSSLWQLLRGRRPYWDNHFEVEARRLSGEAAGG